MFGILDLEVVEGMKNLNEMDHLVAEETWSEVPIRVAESLRHYC